MALLVNGAGVSAADPILKGLGIKLAFAASSIDIASVTNAWLDNAAGFPGTNSVRTSLSPDPDSVFTAGTTGSYNDTNDQVTISDTTGLAAGDAIFLSHASITDGIYVIGSVVNGTDITLRGDPLDGSGALSNMSYQVAYVYDGVAGTAPSVSDAAGDENFFKAEAADSVPVSTQASDTFWVRDSPAGALLVAIDSQSYTGSTTSDPTPTLDVLSGWANEGGVETVELVSASGIEWGDTGVAERTLTTAETQGLSLTGGDGLKTATLRLRAFTGSAVFVDVPLSITLDTSGPTLVLTAFAR